MSDRPSDSPAGGPEDARPGSWIGAAACAVGLGASLTIITLGGMALMAEGGFVASGGPYQIAHPVPQGFWLLPVAFIGCWVFPAVFGVFASRIGGFGLVYATWCAAWLAIGGTTFWDGFHPPGGHGLAWGWLVMGGIFLVVGLASTGVYIWLLRSPGREPSRMPASRRLPYAGLVIAALASGVAVGLQIFGAVVG